MHKIFERTEETQNIEDARFDDKRREKNKQKAEKKMLQAGLVEVEQEPRAAKKENNKCIDREEIMESIK